MTLLGIDIGGTKCAVSLGNWDEGRLTLIGKRKFDTVTGIPPEKTLESLVAHIELLARESGVRLKDVHACGISCGGPLDSVRGVILSPPNLPGWDDVPVVEWFQNRLGVPTYLQNDANACALAEWKYGAAQGYKNVIFLTFGTGMGAGLILDGRLYAGTNDMAGEIGHVRLERHGPVGYGKEGSFEGFCSGAGIAQLAKTMVLEAIQQGKQVSFCPDLPTLASLDAQAVGVAANGGDEVAKAILAASGRKLGAGLAILVDLLNPELIVIGSIFQRCEAWLAPAMELELGNEAVHRSQSVCRVVAAKLGETLGDYAALATASYGRTNTYENA